MLVFRLVLAMWIGSLFSVGSLWGQLIVAHRGSSYEAPENTLAAFNLAWQQHSDGIEGDFYLTADKQIVCIHDPDTERTAGVKRIVEQSTLAELRQFDVGMWKAEKWKGQSIPTLEQVHQTVPKNKTFVIELKSKKAIVPVLARKLERLDTSSIRVLIISFDQATVAACKKQMPQFPAHWLTRFKEDGLGRGDFHPSPRQIADTVLRIGADGVGMKGNRQVIDAAFIRQLAAAGCEEFHVWTIDTVSDARYFQQLGAMGITTNRPALMKANIRRIAETSP